MCSKERWIGFFKYYAMEKNLGVVLDSPKFDFEHITELKKKKKNFGQFFNLHVFYGKGNLFQHSSFSTVVLNFGCALESTKELLKNRDT